MVGQAKLPDPDQEPTISVERAGEVLGLSRGSSYRAVGRGEIPSLRFGKRLVVPTVQLLKLLESK
jgi:excisionase family DNA binding protein